MLLDRMKGMESLTESEQVFVDYVSDNNRSILEKTILEIAKDNYISASTIVRFCKKLGYTGYAQFKSEYISEYQETQRVAMNLKERPFTSTTSIDEAIHNLPLIYYRSIDFAKSSINKETILRCMNYINEHDFIAVYANGINRHLAEMFAYKCQEVGKQVIVYDSSHWQAMDYYHNSSTRVFAILLSHSANNVMIVDAAKRLHAVGIKKLLISSQSETALHRICEEHLQIIKTKSTLEFSNTVYSISMQYILDLFVALLLIKNFDHIDRSTQNTLMINR